MALFRYSKVVWYIDCMHSSSYSFRSSVSCLIIDSLSIPNWLRSKSSPKERSQDSCGEWLTLVRISSHPSSNVMIAGLAVLISVELYWMRLVGTQGDCCIVPVTMDYGLLMEWWIMDVGWWKWKVKIEDEVSSGRKMRYHNLYSGLHKQKVPVVSTTYRRQIETNNK